MLGSLKNFSAFLTFSAKNMDRFLENKCYDQFLTLARTRSESKHPSGHIGRIDIDGNNKKFIILVPMR
jgi:hypothetical protein